MSPENGILLIGGGVASVSAATELRRLDYAGPISLVTRELISPYHRPPVSKGLLRGSGEDVQILPDSWWADNDVQLLTKSPVMKLDTQAQVATLANKSELPYAHALVATGAMVRRLLVDGAALQGIHYLRAPMNADQLNAELTEPRNVVLVGGSFIAVEVAATLRSMGHSCTMVMLEDRCLGQSFGGAVAHFVDELLRDKGIDMVCSAEVAAFEGEGRVTGVRTADGKVIPADLVVVGAGAVPDVKLARTAGLDIGATGGIACDAHLRTSAPNVFAAGDACEYDSVLHGRPVRIEHERHAEAQGVTAARNMVGVNEPHAELPYFWTDIANWASLEYVGLAGGVDHEVVTGSIDDGQFTVWQFKQDQLVSAVTSGVPTDLEVARLVISGVASLPAHVSRAAAAV